MEKIYSCFEPKWMNIPKISKETKRKVLSQLEPSYAKFLRDKGLMTQQQYAAYMRWYGNKKIEEKQPHAFDSLGFGDIPPTEVMRLMEHSDRERRDRLRELGRYPLTGEV